MDILAVAVEIAVAADVVAIHTSLAVAVVVAVAVQVVVAVAVAFAAAVAELHRKRWMVSVVGSAESWRIVGQKTFQQHSFLAAAIERIAAVVVAAAALVVVAVRHRHSFVAVAVVAAVVACFDRRFQHSFVATDGRLVEVVAVSATWHRVAQRTYHPLLLRWVAEEAGNCTETLSQLVVAVVVLRGSMQSV